MPIIGNLPNNLTNGSTADATQVMANFNAIINGVNANAASITGVQASSYNYAADTGTVNALIISPSNPPTVLLDGMEFRTKAANTNTSSTVTAQIGGIPAVGVVVDQAGTLPVIGSIIQNMYYRLVYSSGLGKLILKDPSRATSSATITYTGMTTTVTATMNIAIEPSGKLAEAWVTTYTTGTSNATTFPITGVPSSIVPATNAPYIMFPATDSGGSTFAMGQWGSTVGLSKGAPVNGAWTSTGVKGLRQWNVVINLD